MITKDKVTEIFCIIDEFDKKLDGELKKNLHLPNQNGNGKRYRNRKVMLRKRYIIECINGLLKNKANLVHSRHRSIHNFIMNLCSALTAYCFFDNKPEALTCLCRKIKAVRTKCCIRILSRTRVYKGDSARIYVWFKFYRTAINLNLQLKRGVIPPLSAVLPSP